MAMAEVEVGGLWVVVLETWTSESSDWCGDSDSGLWLGLQGGKRQVFVEEGRVKDDGGGEKAFGLGRINKSG